MIDAKRASSSANVVSIRTCVFGSFERISRVASMPLPSASRTSITTTSGRAHSARSMASLTVAASPATDIPPASSSSALTPLRTTSWSSTIMTRSGKAVTQAMFSSSRCSSQFRRLEGELDSYGRSLAGGRLDGKPPPDRFNPLPHVTQALSPRTASTGLEATAVVVDLEEGALVALQEADPAGGRLGVPRHVGERFPRHLHKLRRGVSKLRRDSLVDLYGRHDPALLLELLDQEVQRLVELAVGKDTRAQAEDVVAQVPDRHVDAVDGAAEPGTHRFGIAGLSLGSLQVHADREQRLDHSVVQLLGNPL